MATLEEEIQKYADMAYAAQTTGIASNIIEAQREKILELSGKGSSTKYGFDDDFISAQELLNEYGYKPGDAVNFYTDSTLNTAPIDEGLAAYHDAKMTAVNEYGYIDSTPENIEKYGGKINPATGEPYKFMVNDNVANAELIKNLTESQGISTIALLPSGKNWDKDLVESRYTETYDDQEGRIADHYGAQGFQMENALQWVKSPTRKLTNTTAGGGTGGGGTVGSGTVDTGGGNITGGYTTDSDSLDVDDTDLTSFVPTQVSSGQSGTYTVPAQTFEDLFVDQKAEFEKRAEEQEQFYQPQTISEMEEAGQDVSSFALSQKLFRNPNTGHQIFIAYQGDQPLQPIPAGYYEVNQASGQFGAGQNVYNPVTAGGNTFTPYTVATNTGGYIQGFSGEDGSVVEDTEIPDPNPIDPSQIYGDVTYTDPVTGDLITQTPDEYQQSLANKQANATFNPATSVAMPGVTTMAELGYVYNEDGTIATDPLTGEFLTEELMPGTVIESTAGQADGLAPIVETPAQVTDVSQAMDFSEGIPDTSTADLTQAATGIRDELGNLTAVTSDGPTKEIEAAQADGTSVSDLEAATGESIDVTGAPTRTLDNSELITETGVDQSKVIEAFGEGELQAASVQDELAGLMQQFEGGDTPAWAAGSMRKAMATLAQRGLGASSMAGQAVIQAAMESALPIAQIDASNKQQMALFKGEQRAKFLQMDFDQAFQAKIINAAKVSEIANMNFNAEQQIALENSRAANTVNLQNLSNKQALIMAEAAALSQLDMANLNNLQQAAVQNAQNFLQIDMANLNNEQQTALFKAQQVTTAMLSDTAQANATAQFNAQSENQANQFFSNLSAQISQFNAAQQNAINQFNAEEANALLEFNSALQNQREMFNAQNYLVVAQANAQWRQNINTANTEAQNVANLTYAKEVNGLTQKALDDYWQKERDIMSYAFAQSEGAADRALKILLGEQNLEGIRARLEFEENEAKSEFWSDLIFGDASFSDLFKI